MIALIPARGGSKGLVDKNIRLLDGKPLISYTIEAAIKSKHITRVIVSTDSFEIAEISKKYGAEIPFMRPSHLATDNAKSIDVFNYTIDRLQNQEKKEIPEIIILQPTSPLRNNIHIDEAVKIYGERNADSLVSYCKEDHSIFWHKYIKDDGRFEKIFEDDFMVNRQDLRATYYPNGAIYIIKSSLLRKGTYYTENSYSYIMDRQFSVDIDTFDDFEYAEYLLNKSKLNN